MIESGTTTKKDHSSSSSAYNTDESLPSSNYSDQTNCFENVLKASATMYTNEENLQHTIQIQEQLFRERLRLDTIQQDEEFSEHVYDNIDSESTDVELENDSKLNSLSKKKNSTLKVRFNDQFYTTTKRRTNKTQNNSTRTTEKSKSILTNPKQKQKLSISSKIFTVNIA